jgi:erythromycin esterase
MIGRICGKAEGHRCIGIRVSPYGNRIIGIRRKISEYLIREMGFTAILMEAGFPNSLDIENYITKGEGHAGEAHQNLGAWRYQEMRDLIDWMRSYNMEQSDPGRMVHFLGYDCAFHNWDMAIEVLSGYMHTVDPGAGKKVEGHLENYTPEDARWTRDWFTLHEEEYIQRSDSLQYGLMMQIAENLEPNYTVWYNLRNDLPDYDIRETSNIGNVQWIINKYLNGAKVIVWAHNGHVGNTLLEDNGGTLAPMLGMRLKELYEDDYYVIATEFYGGQFLAWDRCENHAYEFVMHQAAVPPENSYAYRFHNEQLALFFLDLRHANLSMTETAWLAGPLNMRFIGASYCAFDDRYFYRSMSLAEEFDGLVYFENTHPATPVSF